MKPHLLLLLALALVACRPKSIELTPFTAGQSVSLSVVADGFRWQSGDVVRVAVGEASSEFRLVSGEGTATGVFEGQMPADSTSFAVFYPAVNPDLTRQTYCPDTFPAGKMLYGDDACILDYPVTLTPQWATFCAWLYGDCRVGKLVLQNDESLLLGTTLVCDEPVVLGATVAEAKRFFIVLPNITDTFTLSIYDESLTLVRSVSAAAIESSVVSLCFAPVSASSGRSTCPYVQLWADGPKWAEFNAGSTLSCYANDYTTANVGGLYAFGCPDVDARTAPWTAAPDTANVDVAAALWGEGWQTPSYDDLKKLCSNAYTMRSWCNGTTMQYLPGCTLRGYMVTGVGDYALASIFLPAAGCFDFNYQTVLDSSVCGDYWSSRASGSNATRLLFDIDHFYLHTYSRSFGRSVRPILRP